MSGNDSSGCITPFVIIFLIAIAFALFDNSSITHTTQIFRNGQWVKVKIDKDENGNKRVTEVNKYIAPSNNQKNYNSTRSTKVLVGIIIIVFIGGCIYLFINLSNNTKKENVIRVKFRKGDTLDSATARALENHHKSSKAKFEGGARNEYDYSDYGTSLDESRNGSNSNEPNFGSNNKSERDLISTENNEEEDDRKIIGHTGFGNRINPSNGNIEEKGPFGWSSTDKRFDSETGYYEKRNPAGGWKETGTRVDPETGIIQEKGLWTYLDTETRINQDTGRIEKKGILSWIETDQRIDPDTGKSQHKAILGGWIDD